MRFVFGVEVTRGGPNRDRRGGGGATRTRVGAIESR
jgi:hypothetical protein